MTATKNLFVVRTGETVWEPVGRLESLSGVPLTDAGRETLRRIGKQLVPHEPTAIYASDGEAEHESAAILSKELGLKVRQDAGLVEIDFGLWQGVTLDEIRHRQPKLVKQWLERPGGAKPSGGESVAEAQKRVCRAVRQIVKRVRTPRPLVVLRPVILALLRCRLENAPLEEAWAYRADDGAWSQYPVTPERLSMSHP